jgi:hypothetical protein
VIVTLPEAVVVTLEEFVSKTPIELVPVPQEVPLIVRLPELAVTEEKLIDTPLALLDPFAAVPVIVTLPEPVDLTFDKLIRETPLEKQAVLHEVPLIVRSPFTVVMQAPTVKIP